MYLSNLCDAFLETDLFLNNRQVTDGDRVEMLLVVSSKLGHVKKHQRSRDSDECVTKGKR